jgi:sortase A
LAAEVRLTPRDLLSRFEDGWRRLSTEGSAARYVRVTSLLVLAVLALGFCADLVVVSRFEYRAAQTRDFDRLRNELGGKGKAPVAQVDLKGRVLPEGAPVALLTIPRLHLRTVVVEGTTPEVLTTGPGHLRDTVLPGQAGTSVILGRAAAFGGPFGGIHRLRPGDVVTVVSGTGTANFTVVDVRKAGDYLPALPDGGARLTLVTATGPPFLPSGVLRVDADMRDNAPQASPVAFSSVPHSEVPLGTDTSTLWELAFIMEGLIVASVGAVLAWRRWGHAQTWIVFFPLMSLFGYYAADQLIRLLPNLM